MEISKQWDQNNINHLRWMSIAPLDPISHIPEVSRSMDEVLYEKFIYARLFQAKTSPLGTNIEREKSKAFETGERV